MKIREYIDKEHPGLLVIDDHDNAIIGVGGAYNQAAVIYDAAIIIENLMKKGMSAGEASEYLHYNIAGCYSGENTPIIVHDKG